jgi:hypothetical protein
MEPEDIQQALSDRMQMMDSWEADFEKKTWTFGGNYSFTVSAGQYLIISAKQWDEFWSTLGKGEG